MIGVIHTNYVDYARRTAPASAVRHGVSKSQLSLTLAGPEYCILLMVCMAMQVHIVYHANKRMTNIHCHKVCPLTVQHAIARLWCGQSITAACTAVVGANLWGPAAPVCQG